MSCVAAIAQPGEVVRFLPPIDSSHRLLHPWPSALRMYYRECTYGDSSGEKVP